MKGDQEMQKYSKEFYLKHKNYFVDYQKEHYKRYSFCLNKEKDSEVIEWLKGKNIAKLIRDAYKWDQELAVIVERGSSDYE